MSTELSLEITAPPTVQQLAFPGGTIEALQRDGHGWMVLKPACSALQIDDEAQRKRLERARWATACIIQAVGADGKLRQMYCLRADRVGMWLATLDASRIKDEARRERLELWQCEAADALNRWMQKPAIVGVGAGAIIRADPLLSLRKNAWDPERRPGIEIGPDRYRVADAALVALAALPDIFQKDYKLVRVVHPSQDEETGELGRWGSKPVIQRLTSPLLFIALSEAARFYNVRYVNGELREVEANPPDWCVSMLRGRGSLRPVRHLEVVLGIPVVIGQWSTTSLPLYDEATGFLYSPIPSANLDG